MTIRKLHKPHRPSHKKNARLHLPHMSTDEALLVVAILEKAAQAIWRAHGDNMANRLAAADVETPRPEDARREDNQAAEDIGF